MKRCISSKIKQKKFAQNRPPISHPKSSYLFESKIAAKGSFERDLQILCQSVIELECCYQITNRYNHDPIAILSAAAQRKTETHCDGVLEYYNQFYDRLQVIEEIRSAT